MDGDTLHFPVSMNDPTAGPTVARISRGCSRTDASVAALPLASAAERQYR